MSVLVLNTLSEYNDEVLELQNQICAQSEGSEVVYTREMKISHCIGCNYCWLKTPYAFILLYYPIFISSY